MIILRLAGGLGNQLFQITFANYLAFTFDMELVVDKSGLGRYITKRDPDVLRLISVRTSDDLPAWKRVPLSLFINSRIGRFQTPISCNNRNLNKWLSTSSRLGRNFIIVDGYFQEPVVGYDFQKALGLLNYKTDSFENMKMPLADCVMHIRGTDFLSYQQHNIVDANYYVMGIDLLKKIRLINKVEVITDDLRYANFLVSEIVKAEPHIEFHISEPARDILNDFLIIRDAPARIIPNSTFSWWAAALDKSKSPTIAPSVFSKSQNNRIKLDYEIIVNGY
jgi:hypothetical protein